MVNSLKHCNAILWQRILCLVFHIIYISITCIHIYSSICDISVNLLHMYTWIFYTHVFYLIFFQNCCLPGVSSAIIALLHIISPVFSLRVTVGDDDEPNNVEFVLIYIYCEFTEIFQWYCMTKYTLHCFLYHTYLLHALIYIYIC